MTARLAALAGALALLVPATAAHAAEVSSDGTTITVSGGAEPSRVTVSIGESGAVEVGDGLNPMVAGPGCTYSEHTGLVSCPAVPGTVRVDLGAGDDRLVALPLGNGSLADGQLQADLGPGDDEFQGDVVREVVHGGAGHDALAGAQGADLLDGGDGHDTLEGDSGDDDVRGGPGDDTLSGDPSTNPNNGADKIDGGPGRDRLKDYWTPLDRDPRSVTPVSVTLNGVADDGQPGERDDVAGIEDVKFERTGSFSGDDAPNSVVVPEVSGASSLTGHGGDDELVAGDAAGDRVDGGAGADALQGGFGDDVVIGGPGADRISADRPARCNEVHCDVTGGYGNDVVEARDGEADAIDCGPGTDRVVADAADVVAPDCEHVDRAATSGPGHQGGPGREAVADGVRVRPARKVALRTALRRGLAVEVTGVDGLVRLTASIDARTAKRARLGRRAVVVARGAGRGTVTLRFTKAARRKLARLGSVQLEVGGDARATLALQR